MGPGGGSGSRSRGRLVTVVPLVWVACRARLGSPWSRQPPSWTAWWCCQQIMARLPIVVGDGHGTTWWASRKRVAVQPPKRQPPSRRSNARRMAGETTRAVVPTPTVTPSRSCTTTCMRPSHTSRRAVSVARGCPVSSSAVAPGSSSQIAASSTTAVMVARSGSASPASVALASASRPSARRWSGLRSWLEVRRRRAGRSGARRHPSFYGGEQASAVVGGQRPAEAHLEPVLPGSEVSGVAGRPMIGRRGSTLLRGVPAERADGEMGGLGGPSGVGAGGPGEVGRRAGLLAGDRSGGRGLGQTGHVGQLLGQLHLLVGDSSADAEVVGRPVGDVAAAVDGEGTSGADLGEHQPLLVLQRGDGGADRPGGVAQAAGIHAGPLEARTRTEALTGGVQHRGDERARSRPRRDPAGPGRPVAGSDGIPDGHGRLLDAMDVRWGASSAEGEEERVYDIERPYATLKRKIPGRGGGLEGCTAGNTANVA